MKKQDILYSALITTVLAFSPVLSTPLSAATTKINSLSFSVAQILYNRGLEDEAAKDISEEFFSENEELFSLMLRNLENGCSVLSNKELMNYISSLALQRKSISLDSYTDLAKMMFEIKNKVPSQKTLKELQNIATKNFLYSQQTGVVT